MRVKINDKDIFENVSGIEIVTGPNQLYVAEDDNHRGRNFRLETATSRCDDCESFHDEDCFCDKGD